MSLIRIGIVDDVPVFRKSLRGLLESEPGISVVAEAKNGQEGIDLVERHHPDVVLMDINMPVMDGFEATRIIMNSHPGTRVIILSMHSESSMVAMSCAAGACYHLCKDCSPRELITAIRDGHQQVRT